MNITYKIADTADVPIIHKLANEIWKKHYPDIISHEQIDYMLQKMYSADSIKKQMDEGHQFTLVYLDGVPEGYISVTKKNDNHFFIHKFYVSVDKHGKGIGSSLFHYILSQMPANSIIELTVNRQNIKAINFYFKKGFVIKEVADFDIGSGFVMNDFIMEYKHIL